MSSFDEATWLNEPPRWKREGGSLSVVTGGNTDFWQNTYYGFVHDNGHFLHVRAEGDFTASIAFAGRYEELYDQAGLMVRLDEKNWIKLGIEFSDGLHNFSFVATLDGRSDWSVLPHGDLTGPQSVRLTRRGDALVADYRRPGGAWQMMRLCPFPPASAVAVGPMTCSPKRAAFEVTFTDFIVGPAILNPLHGP